MFLTLLAFTLVWAQRGSTSSGGAGAGAGAMIGMACFALFYLAILAASIIGLWKVFEKAGKPGWAAIVPIYNLIVFFEITGKPLWWVALAFIPGCGGLILMVLMFLATLELANRFGKSGAYAAGLFFLSPIFYPMLGFSDAQYRPGGGSGRRRAYDDEDEDEDEAPRPKPRRRDDDEGEERVRKPRRDDY